MQPHLNHNKFIIIIGWNYHRQASYHLRQEAIIVVDHFVLLHLLHLLHQAVAIAIIVAAAIAVITKQLATIAKIML